jgi:hypothetical protein
MPAGTYTVHVDVRPTGGGAPGTGALRFVLRNPSGVELLFPFDGDQQANTFPLFQWRYDGIRSRIRVFEKLPGQTTAEEAASGVPQLVADVTSNSFQYPVAGVRTLEPGKTYVWFVEGYSRTAGGTDQVARSAIRTFTVSAGGSSSGSLASYLEELERVLGPRFAPVFDQIRSGLYAPTGELRLDGGAISTVDLLRLITLLRTQPDAVLSVTLE